MAFSLTLILAFHSLVAFPAPRKLNIVVILADDLGWTDLGCFGSDLYQTPHIDELARDGMKFTQTYSACTVCSPTRSALMTGKHPGRLHITDWIPGLPPENPKLTVPDFTRHLPLEELTIAEVFRAAGYATASIGKWHLGGPQFYPDKQGFDINLAGTEKPSPPTYFAPWGISTLEEGQPGDYLTERLGNEAVKWIEAQKDKPFFLYLSHFAVHTPIQGPPDLVEKYRALKRAGRVHQNAVYAAMIDRLDDTVGRIRATLDALNLSGHTAIIFTSDNGGRVPTTSNRPLRAGKGSCYEGGTRVPLIISWPGVTRSNTTNDTPVITMDLFPTLAEMAGAPIPPDLRPDGISLVPVLRGTGHLAARDLFWHYPHYQHYQQGGTTPYGAIRAGDFKLIEFFDGLRVELYDLGRDVGEQHNLAAIMPARVNELRFRLHAWQRETKVQMPTRNPKYDPSRPEHTPPARTKS